MRWRDKVRHWAELYRRALATRLRPIRSGDLRWTRGRLVVSLTSHRPCFSHLNLTLRSLLSQDVQPDLLVLWIAYDDVEALPRSVTRLQLRGLVICQCADTGPYKAIVPALEAYPHAFIVTAHDNVYYPPDWLRRLLQAYRHPCEILCRSARRATLRRGVIAPYAEWEHLGSDGETGPHVFFTGAGGVLYPPGTLATQARDEDAFLRLCPANADIWLNWMAGLAGAPVRLVDPFEPLAWPDPLRDVPWRRRQSPADIDDHQIDAMVEAYGLLHAPARQRELAQAAG